MAVGKPASCDDTLRTRPGLDHRIFIAGPENQLALTAILTVLQNWGTRFNPLTIYGAAGTGKSLLASGLAAAFKSEFPRAIVEHITAVDFARQFTSAFDSASVEEFSAPITSSDLLVVEDVHLLSGWPLVQEELIRAIDEFTSTDRQVVATLGSYPEAENGLAIGLRNRLVSGLAVRLVEPGLLARREMLGHAAASQGIELSNELAAELAKESGTFRELQARLLLQTVHPTNCRSSKPLSKVNPDSERDTLSRIARMTARHFGLRLSDLYGPSRQRNMALARAVAMYLARESTPLSFDRIGRFFGGRDHSTVMHSWRKINHEFDRDPYIRNIIERLHEAINQN